MNRKDGECGIVLTREETNTYWQILIDFNQILASNRERAINLAKKRTIISAICGVFFLALSPSMSLIEFGYSKYLFSAVVYGFLIGLFIFLGGTLRAFAHAAIDLDNLVTEAQSYIKTVTPFEDEDGIKLQIPAMEYKLARFNGAPMIGVPENDETEFP